MNGACPFGTETGHYLSNPTVEVSLKGEAQQFCQKHLAFLTDDMNFLGCFDRQPYARLNSTGKTTANQAGTL